ncbi:hypothetical protein [Bdellovibrio sp. HCB337]|uniref:hypothetical protein n=1 Tax=Bdellovibrio sp. HCB337 TaxID=3394358 RepID=UPI0039A59617
MHAQQEYRDSLKHLSSLLAKTHKALVDYELSLRELQVGECFNAGTKLQMLIQDPAFAWLRTMSQLMVLVDDAIYQKEPLAEEQYLNLREEVKKLMVDKTTTEFARPFDSICKKVPEIRHEHDKIVSFLEQRPSGYGPEEAELSVRDIQGP